MKSNLNEKEIRAQLPDTMKDFDIVVLDTVDSTNNYAKKLQVQTAAIVTADEQTGGRGRHGKSFFSPKQSGIYMSLILKTDTPPDLMTVAAAVAAARVIEKISGLGADIKWVNDIFLNGRKVSGTLCEALTGERGIEAVVIGVGINLTTVAFPDEISAIAGSVFPKDFSRSEIVAALAAELYRVCKTVNPAEILPEYKKRLFVLGQQIEYTKDGILHTAVAEDINECGNLIVSENGRREVLFSGEISLKSSNFV